MSPPLRVGLHQAQRCCGARERFGLGDAAAWFDPLDVDEMAATTAELLDSPARREELIAAGSKRVTTFSYEWTAREYLDLYRSIARPR